MRLTFILCALAMLAPVPTTQAAINPEMATEHASRAYANGWKAGWDAGWEHVKGKNSWPPPAPYPPYPEYGKDSFQDGYNEGFLAGIAAARKRR